MSRRMRPVTVTKRIEVEVGQITLQPGQFLQVYAGEITVEVSVQPNGKYLICVDEGAEVKTFKQVYKE